MSIIYTNDPDAPAKLRRRLEALEDELMAIQVQDRKAKELGLPKNPPGIADSLRARIRQTKQRIEQITGTPREELQRR